MTPNIENSMFPRLFQTIFILMEADNKGSGTTNVELDLTKLRFVIMNRC